MFSHTSINESAINLVTSYVAVTTIEAEMMENKGGGQVCRSISAMLDL